MTTPDQTMTAPAHETPVVLDDPLEQGRFTRWVTGPQGQRWAESSLQLAGLHCAACSGLIEQAVSKVAGVHSVRVSAAAERATVCWDPDRTRPSLFIAAIRHAGYDAVPDAAAPARALRVRQQRQALWRLFVASFCAMQVMMFATPSYVAAAGELSDEMRQLLNWGSWVVSLPVMVFSAAPYFSGAWQMLRRGRIGMDVPVALGIAITFIASSGATFAPGGVFGAEVYFDSLTMFVNFLLASRWLELRARQGAAETLERALARLPETAWCLDEHDQVSAVSVQRLHVGDRVRVLLGQAFPADGVLEVGSTQADEALLSGESAPVAKRPGDTVVAGSVNVGAPVAMRVQRVGGDTRMETIVSMMRSALTQRPASARVADRWAAPFLWAVLLLAALAAAAWSFIDPARAVWVAVSVLIVTCPCALSLAAPATLVAAARGLARHGVLLQRLDAIEVLANARHFFFDKTGTLTQDRLTAGPAVLTRAGAQHWGDAAVASDGAASDSGANAARSAGPSAVASSVPSAVAHTAASACAASLARWSQHPVSVALAAHGAAQAAAELQWTHIEEVPGQGVSALDDQGRTWHLGRALWVDATTPLPAGTQVALGCQGRLLAGFAIEEALRDGVVQALQALRADGVQLRLLSGDSAQRAFELAARVGITNVMAQATPQDKLAAVVELQARGERVVMVGDGVNDAPVLARADASLAMGQGALVSRCHADAVITSNQLGDLVQARRRARRALAIVRQNFLWAGAYNALCIPLALAGYLPPWAAGLGMAGSSLVVVLNALRAAR